MSERGGAEKDAPETCWVNSRLRRVRGDGTLGTTCLHGVGLTVGLWCGACMDLDPRVIPPAPSAPSHAPRGETTEEEA